MDGRRDNSPIPQYVPTAVCCSRDGFVGGVVPVNSVGCFRAGGATVAAPPAAAVWGMGEAVDIYIINYI
jgi:hypothetical protein